ncbi:MAG TPA: hypothetical protein VJ783_21175 [Pirellulales bacterium]|nr:hypothetical protein [Pirellulales bacterium]
MTALCRDLAALRSRPTFKFHHAASAASRVDWPNHAKPSPLIQNDAHLLTVLRYIEDNPLRARVVTRADDYRWSRYLAHGVGQPRPLHDPLITFPGQHDVLGNSMQSESNPYGSPKQPVADERETVDGWSPLRVLWLFAIAAIIAFVLLKVWMATA